MYLKKSKRKDGRTYLSICKSYRVDGKNKTKTIKSIGYLDQLADLYGDPIAHFETMARAMGEELEQENAPVPLSFDSSEEVAISQRGRKNLGYSVLSYYFHRLNLHTFWQNKAIQMHFPADVNGVFKLLVYSRVLYPGNNRVAFAEKNRWFERNDFSLSDLYRSLGFFCDYGQELISRLNTAIGSLYKRNMAHLYYHVTDFHSDLLSPKTGGSGRAADKGSAIRLGLLLDSCGIPLSYGLFPEETTEIDSLDTILGNLGKERRLIESSRIVIISDKPASAEVIGACLKRGVGFMLSAPRQGQSEDLQAWLTDNAGSQNLGEFRLKSRETTWEGEFGENGETVAVPVKQIAFRRTDFDCLMKPHHANSTRKYVRMCQSGKDGILSACSAPKQAACEQAIKTVAEIPSDSINQDEATLALDEALEGHRVIVTSEIDSTEKTLIDLYRGFWKIESDFSNMESDLLVRPVYVSEREIVEAHFLMCYVELTLLRLICFDLEWRYSSMRICEELSRLECSHLQENWWHFDYRSAITDELCGLAGINLTRKILTLNQIKSILAHTRNHKGRLAEPRYRDKAV